MYQPILMTKLKNEIKRAKPALKDTLQYDLKNININGRKKGCYGFITNPETGITVYVSTEALPLRADSKVMVRVANDNHDYKGYRNVFCKEDVKELVKLILEMLCDNKRHLAKTYAWGRMINDGDLYAEYRN